MLRQYNAPWLDKNFLSCAKEPDHIVHIAKIMAQYLHNSSSSLPAASMNNLAFDKRFARLHVYNHLDYCVNEAIFECWLRSPGDD